MKILHVILELRDANGGPPRGLTNLARAQALLGDDVAVLPCRKTDGPQTLDPGRHGNLVCYAPPTDARLLWYNHALKSTLRKKARDRDVVHIHCTWRYHTLGAAAVAREYGIPYVIRPAGNLGQVCLEHKSFRKRAYFAVFERAVLNRAAALHCCSSKELGELQGLALRPRKFIVPLPVDTDLLHTPPDDDGLRRMLPELSDRPNIVLYMGRICAIKNLEDLVAAFARISAEYPEWLLVLAGPHEDWPLVSMLSTKVREANLVGRIVLPGMVRGGAKAALLRAAAVFAQPSRHENFGMSVAEALMFGRPCLVSNGVALAPEIADAGAGLVVESTADAFEAGLRRLLADAPFREQAARRASHLAQRFTPETVAKCLAREYARCLKADGR